MWKLQGQFSATITRHNTEKGPPVSQLQVAYYCNRDCQKADWSDGHKKECKEEQEAHKLFPWKERFDQDLKDKIASQKK